MSKFTLLCHCGRKIIKEMASSGILSCKDCLRVYEIVDLGDGQFEIRKEGKKK